MSQTLSRAQLWAGGLALLLAGGGLAAVVLLGGDDPRLVEDDVPREPVSGAPEEQWSWPGRATSAAAVGEHVVVGTDAEVIALDADGEEVWTSDAGGHAYSVPRYPDIVFVSTPAFDQVAALSIEDGEELWTVDGYVDGSAEAGLIRTDVDEEDVTLLDASSGEEVWSVTDTEAFALTDDAVYVLDGDQLSRLAIDTGEEEWRVTTDVEPADGDPVTLAANEDLVVLRDDRAVAFDTAEGTELWSEDLEERDEVDVFSATGVYIGTEGDTFEEPVVKVAVYDRDGKVGDLEPDQASGWFSAEPFELDGKPYSYDHASGRVFDEDLQEVGRYDGLVTLVDGGLYTLRGEDGEASYYEIGSASPEWSIDTPWSSRADAEVGLVPLDGRIVVVGEDEVVSYQ